MVQLKVSSTSNAKTSTAYLSRKTNSSRVPPPPPPPLASPMGELNLPVPPPDEKQPVNQEKTSPLSPRAPLRVPPPPPSPIVTV